MTGTGRYYPPDARHVRRLPGGVEVLDVEAVAADLERQRQQEADARQRADAKHEREQAAKRAARQEEELARLEERRRAYVDRYVLVNPDASRADGERAWKELRADEQRRAADLPPVNRVADELRAMRGVRPRGGR